MVLSFAALFALLALCAGGTTPGAASVTPRRAAQLASDGVGRRLITFVDHSRPTFDYLTGQETPGRVLVTDIRYPSDGPAVGERTNAPVAKMEAPYPMIVFAEGYRATPQLYSPLLDAWARAGYVVVSPEFPDTTYPATDPAIRAGYPHGSPEEDLGNEPADLTFVIDQIARLDARHRSFLHGAVDLDETLLAGQSDGATVVAAYVYDPRYDAIRLPVRAAAIFAGYAITSDRASYREPASGAVPALVAQSADDTCNEPELSVQLYANLMGPKYFLLLNDATHLGPFVDSDPLAFATVVPMTLAFFDESLDPGSTTSSTVLAAGRRSGIAESADTPTVPTIPNPSRFPYCAPAY